MNAPIAPSRAPATVHEDGLGGSITILERGGPGSPMKFRMVMPPGFGPPAPECHPSQREDFKVLRGTLDLGKVAGEHVRLREGQTFTLPAGVFHLPKNAGDGELEFEATLTPGLDAARMFEDLYRVTREHQGIGQFVRVSMLFRRFQHTIRFPAPVRFVMTLVAAVGRTLNLKA